MFLNSMKFVIFCCAVFLLYNCQNSNPNKEFSNNPTDSTGNYQQYKDNYQSINDSIVLIKTDRIIYDYDPKGVLKKDADILFSILEEKSITKVKSSSYTGLDMVIKQESIVFSDNSKFGFSENEKTIFYDHSAIYTSQHLIGKNRSYLNKYKLSGNNVSLIKKVEFPSALYSILPSASEQNPSFLVSDAGEGRGFKYILYSHDLDKVLEYVPFENGFLNQVVNTKNDGYLIINENPEQAGIHKFCWISTEKKEIETIKEIDLGEHQMFSAFCFENGILTSQYKTSAFESKGVFYNYAFDKVWESKTEQPFHKVEYLTSSQLFYCKGNTAKLYVLNKDGQATSTIDLLDHYSYDEKEFQNPRTAIVFHDFLPLNNQLILASLAQKTKEGGNTTFKNVTFLVLDDHKIYQKFNSPDEIKNLHFSNYKHNEISIFLGNKMDNYKILH